MQFFSVILYTIRRHFQKHRKQKRYFKIAGLIAAIFALACGSLIFARSRMHTTIRPLKPYLTSPQPLVFGHRGASGYRTENMIPSFFLAQAQGADILELDVLTTKDGVVVVHHDPTLNRVENIDSKIHDLNFAELRKLQIRTQFGERGLFVPTLDEVFRAFPGKRVNIEIKQKEPPMEKELLDVIKKNRRERTVLVGSVSSAVMDRFRGISGGSVAVSASAIEVLQFVGCYRLRLNCSPQYDALQIPTRQNFLLSMLVDLTSRNFISFAHAHGLKVHYWTINEEIDMLPLLESGADGIMTNFPDRGVRAVRRFTASPMRRN